MPCACKKRSSNVSKNTYMYIPSQGVFQHATRKRVTVETNVEPTPDAPAPSQTYLAQLLAVSDSQYAFIIASDSSTYSFAATTKAQQACTLCAAKHIAFASVLLQSSQEYDVCVAAGELNLASAHYGGVDSKLSTYCRDLALYTIHNIQKSLVVIPYVTNLLEFISGQTDVLSELPMQDVRKQMQSFWYACCVLDIASAFSLLFTQVDYLELNKQYAVGYLVRAATAPGSTVIPRNSDLQRYLISKLRQAWKIAQQMQQDSDMYYDCKQRLLALLHNYVGLYILSKKAMTIRRRLNLPPGLISTWLDMSEEELEHNFIYSARRQRKTYFNIQLSDSASAAS